MGGITNFRLGIESAVTGEEQIRALQDRMNAFAAGIEKTKGSAASFPSGFDGWGDKLKNAIENPLSSAGDAAKGLLAALGPAGVGVAATAGVLGALGVAGFEAMKSLGQLGEQVNAISLRTGLSAKEVGQFSFAAKAAGADVGIFETAMRKLSVGLSDAGEDGKKAKEGLKALGVEARDVDGNLKSTSDIFLQISEGMSHMGNAVERNNALVKVFGKSAIELVPTLSELSQNVARAKELGFGLTDADVERFKKYDQQIVEIEAAWDRLVVKMKQGIVGTITYVFGNPEEWLSPSLSGKPARPEQLTGDNYLLPEQLLGRSASLAAQTMQRAQNAPTIAAGQAFIDQMNRARGGSLSGTEAMLSGAKTTQSAAWDALQQSAGTGEANVREKAKAYDVATAAVNRYEAAVKGMRKAEEDAKKVSESLIELHKAANLSESPFMKQTQGFVEKMRGMTMSQSQRGAYGWDLQRLMLNEYGVEREKQTSEWEKSQMAAYKRLAQEWKSDWDEMYKSVDTTMANRAGAAIGLGKGGIDYRYGGELAGAQRSSRLSTGLFNATSQSPTAGIEHGYGSSIALASQTYDIEHRRMEEMLRFEPIETQALKRQTDTLKLKADMQKSMDDARVDREIAYADLQRSNLDAYKEGVGKTFDALLSSGKGGLGSALQSLLMGNVRTIAMNVGGGLFEQAGGSLGKLGGMIPGGDKILKGTLFDPANAALISNTAATIANTAALQTGGFSGFGGMGGLAGGSGSGLSGSSEIGYAQGLYGAPFGEMGTAAKGTNWKSIAGYGAAAAGIGAGAYGIYSGAHAGGGQGAATAIGGAGGVAAAMSLIPSIATSVSWLGPAGMAVGILGGVVAGLMGDPKKNRSEELAREADKARYTMPTGTNYNVDAYGRNIDYGSSGGPRIVININAMDSKSVIDRAHDISEAIRVGLNTYPPLRAGILAAVNV